MVFFMCRDDFLNMNYQRLKTYNNDFWKNLCELKLSSLESRGLEPREHPTSFPTLLVKNAPLDIIKLHNAKVDKLALQYF